MANLHGLGTKSIFLVTDLVIQLREPEGSYGNSFQVTEMNTCSVAQSCLTICDTMDCSPPGSSIHGTLQARILEWVAISSFRENCRPRDQRRISCVGKQTLPLSPLGSPDKLILWPKDAHHVFWYTEDSEWYSIYFLLVCENLSLNQACKQVRRTAAFS